MLNEKIMIGGKTIANRVVIQPMEGCDCNTDGSPHALTIDKYMRFAVSGAGIVWFEANAVCAEGRTNARQMRLTRDNLPAFRTLLKNMRAAAVDACGFAPLMILQLTHSGRQSMTPMIAYRNAVYEEKRPVTDDNIVSDAYLDALPAQYAESARLAVEAGFDGVDVKACHGYLLAELLSAYTRAGRYGGSFENRSRCYMDCLKAVKNAVPADCLLSARIGMTDMVKKPYGFATDENGQYDLTETFRLLDLLKRNGVQIVNVTLGNPYYNPHINRPFRAGAYTPPEPPEAGMQRFYDVQKAIKTKFPDLPIVGSGLSYYRDNLMDYAEKLLTDGVCDFVGFGRESLAYPSFYRDYRAGKFDAKKCCVACSKCTRLMRAGCVSGCAVFNEYYRNLYKEKGL